MVLVKWGHLFLFLIIWGAAPEGRAAGLTERRAESWNPKKRRAEVVAQASFSWAFGPIHLLAPYGVVSHPKGGQLT